MTKGGKTIKYMVKNAKARKILKKVKKMRKNVMFVLAWVCESQIIKSVAQSSKPQSIKSSHGRLTGLAVLQEWSGEGSDEPLIAAKYIVF